MPRAADEREDRRVRLHALLAAVWPKAVDGAEPGEATDVVQATSARDEAGPRVEQFETVSPEWWDSDRVFGGMVVAQALGAAMQTVDADVPVHSLHGYFLRPTRPGDRVAQAVAHVRDGRAFSVRRVTSSVEGRAVFEQTCSFHRPEEGDTYQVTMPDVPGPHDVPAVELPIPLEMRELGATARRSDGTYEATRRVWVRTAGPVGDDPRLHACVLAYLSDMTGASFRPHSLGTWGGHTDASLDHALWFHRPVRVDRWLLFDLQALVNSAGRATVRGVLFDEAGELGASMAQELLIRPLDEPVVQSVAAWGTESEGSSGGAAALVDPTQL